MQPEKLGFVVRSGVLYVCTTGTLPSTGFISLPSISVPTGFPGVTADRKLVIRLDSDTRRMSI